MTTELLKRPVPGDDPHPKVAEKKNTAVDDGWILMRIEPDDDAHAAIPCALAIASSLGRRLRLIEVLHSRSSAGHPADPIEWDLRRREAHLQLQRLATRYSTERCVIDFRVVEHFTPAEAGACDTGTKPISGFIRHYGRLPWQLDASSRRFLEESGCTILLVPDNLHPGTSVPFTRVMVPLDGSARAEKAAAEARRIALRQGIDLYLVHVSPDVQLTGNGMLDAEGIELRSRLMQRNTRTARKYLDSMKRQLAADQLTIHTHLFEGDDVRRQLLAQVRQQPASLIVLASHGCGGHRDVLAGSIASFILEHSPVPVLMIGQESASVRDHLYSDTVTHGVRLPTDPHSAG